MAAIINTNSSDIPTNSFFFLIFPPPSLVAELLWNEPPSRLSSEELENTAPFSSDFRKVEEEASAGKRENLSFSQRASQVVTDKPYTKPPIELISLSVTKKQFSLCSSA